MTIVHLINVRWLNATAWYALRLSETAILRGDRAAIAGLPDSPVVIAAKELGIPVLEAPFTSNSPIAFYKNMKKLHAFIKENNADALVCHRGEMFWIAALDKYFGKRPYKLIRVRGDVRPVTKDIFSRFFHNKCCDHIVTSAEFIRKDFINGLKTPPAKIDTIYGGVNRSVFHRDERTRMKTRLSLGIYSQDFAAGVIGRFDPVKGHGIFLKACGEAYKNGMKNLKVVLAGFPENIKISDMEKMIEENGLKEIAVITGKRSDIAAVAGSLDLGVISSIGSEAICRAAMEIMACGVPVVSSCAGVLPEMIPDEYRYENDDYKRLSELIAGQKGFIKIYDQEDFYKEFLMKTGLSE